MIITGSGFAADAQVLFGITPALVGDGGVADGAARPCRRPTPAGVVNVSVENPGAPPDVEVAGFIYVGMSRVPARSGETRVITRNPGD